MPSASIRLSRRRGMTDPRPGDTSLQPRVRKRHDRPAARFRTPPCSLAAAGVIRRAPRAWRMTPSACASRAAFSTHLKAECLCRPACARGPSFVARAVPAPPSWAACQPAGPPVRGRTPAQEASRTRPGRNTLECAGSNFRGVELSPTRKLRHKKKPACATAPRSFL